MVSDVIQLDRLRFGANREGIYASCKTFLEKISYAVAGVFVGSVIAMGSADGKATAYGLQLSGLIAGIFALLSILTFILYNEKGIMKFIRNHKSAGKPMDEKTLAKANKIGFFDRIVISELTPSGEVKVKKPGELDLVELDDVVDTTSENVETASREETDASQENEVSSSEVDVNQVDATENVEIECATDTETTNESEIAVDKDEK